MTSKRPSDENVFGGSWSVRKLDCVSHYLEAYLQVFKAQNWAELWYFDAFCGNGVQGIKSLEAKSCAYESDDEGIEFVEGSALRVLKVAEKRRKKGNKSFDHFVFIEMDDAKLGELQARIEKEYPEQLSRCNFIADDVNSVLPNVLKAIDWNLGRAVGFIDPCATQLKWQTLEAFSGTKTDIWLLFPLEAIIRMLPKKNLPNDAWSQRLDNIFGNDNWRQIYYDPTDIQPTLFDLGPTYERNEGIQDLLTYATGRFKEVFPCVLDPGILKNTMNSPLFALYALITNDSKQAQKIAKRIASHLIKSLNEKGPQ